jgi:molecular chaperone GrpE (heat shock protein)
MAEETDFDPNEFEAEMQRLSAEAESSATSEAAERAAKTVNEAAGSGSGSSSGGSGGGGGEPKSGRSPVSEKAIITAIAQLIRPIAVQMASIDQRTKEANKSLDQVLEAVQKEDEGEGEGEEKAPGGSEPSSGANQQDWQKVVDMLQEQKRHEGTNQKLFDAMHAEMKDYKDIFLFEALQKPIIQDMLLLYDDLSAIEGQSKHFRRKLKAREEQGGEATPDEETREFVGNLLRNLENLKILFVEIFDRLEVEQIKTGKGKLDKQKQKALSVTETPNEEEDGMVERKLRPGFMWRDRVLRPEEVIIKRYRG